MIRGGSVAKGTRGGRGRTVISSVKGSLQLGNENIEFDGELKYTKKDGTVNKIQRPILEAWESKRATMKVEWANSIGYNGGVYGEIRGKKGYVATPRYYQDKKGVAFTHIHPREDGALGGTFSIGDIENWAPLQGQTKRAVAKEGTYSISKGKNFNANGLTSFYKQLDKTVESNYRSAVNQINNDYKNGKITYNQAIARSNKVFNNSLIERHNALLNNQKTYGYNYYLEKR